eukprot:5703226-Pyramimonas_sp.AAC.1
MLPLVRSPNPAVLLGRGAGRDPSSRSTERAKSAVSTHICTSFHLRIDTTLHSVNLLVVVESSW